MYNSKFIQLSCIQSYFLITALQMACWCNAKKLADYCSWKGMLSFLYFALPFPLATCLSPSVHVASKPSKYPEEHNIFRNLHFQCYWHSRASSITRKSFTIFAMLAPVQTLSIFFIIWLHSVMQADHFFSKSPKEKHQMMCTLNTAACLRLDIALRRICSSGTACWLCYYLSLVVFMHHRELPAFPSTKLQ